MVTPDLQTAAGITLVFCALCCAVPLREPGVFAMPRFMYLFQRSSSGPFTLVPIRRHLSFVCFTSIYKISEGFDEQHAISAANRGQSDRA